MDSPSLYDSVNYSETIQKIIDASGELIKHLPEDQPGKKKHAFQELADAVEDLRAPTAQMEQEGALSEGVFQAAVDMQAGYLLFEAQRGIECRDRAGIQRAVSNLVAEKKVSEGAPVTEMMFDADLLHPPGKEMTDASALADFKIRAERTLDNMVKEARDVLSIAIKQIKETFDKFSEALEKILHSFSASEGVITEGIKKIISSLQQMADLVKDKGLQRIIASLKEMVEGFDLNALLAKVFGCERTKDAITELESRATAKNETFRGAATRMAELSREYVLRLKQMKRLLSIVGFLGGALLLTGVGAAYTQWALPVAYALIALTIIVIGIDFAEIKMRRLISSL